MERGSALALGPAVVSRAGLFGRVSTWFPDVELGWLRLTDHEVTMLGAHQERNADRIQKARPRSPPLYRRGRWDWDGLAIYEEGLRAAFCLGRIGKKQFVLWEAIEGAYPARGENPGVRTDLPEWMGGKLYREWQELQVELVDGRVFCVDGRKHDLGAVQTLVAQRMGPRWAEVFHSEAALSSDPFRGDTYLHRIVREDRADGGPKGEFLPIHWDHEHLTP
jgi:hypothetical protein